MIDPVLWHLFEWFVFQSMCVFTFNKLRLKLFKAALQVNINWAWKVIITSREIQIYIIDTQSFFYCAQSYILAIKDILPPKYLSSSFKFCTRINWTYLMEANTCGHLNLCRNGVITLPTRLSAHKCRVVWSRIMYEKKFVMPNHIQSPIFSGTWEIIKLIILLTFISLELLI